MGGTKSRSKQITRASDGKQWHQKQRGGEQGGKRQLERSMIEPGQFDDRGGGAGAGQFETGADLEHEARADLARQHPSRITHGFWLKQYSGLHERRSPPDAQPALAETPPDANGGERDNYGRPRQRRNRLMAHWNNLVTRAASATSETKLAEVGREQARSAGARSAPPSSAGAQARWQPKRARTSLAKQQESAPAQNHAHKFGCQLCLARGTSNSSGSEPVSRSPSPSLGSLKAKQMQARGSAQVHQPQPQPHRLANWLTTTRPAPTLAHDAKEANTRLAGAKRTHAVDCETSSPRLSPYRQIARLLGGHGDGPSQSEASDKQQVAERREANSGRNGASRNEPKAAQRGAAANLFASLFASPTKRFNARKRQATRAHSKANEREDESNSSSSDDGGGGGGGEMKGRLQVHEAARTTKTATSTNGAESPLEATSNEMQPSGSSATRPEVARKQVVVGPSKSPSSAASLLSSELGAQADDVASSIVNGGRPEGAGAEPNQQHQRTALGEAEFFAQHSFPMSRGDEIAIGVASAGLRRTSSVKQTTSATSFGMDQRRSPLPAASSPIRSIKFLSSERDLMCEQSNERDEQRHSASALNARQPVESADDWTDGEKSEASGADQRQQLASQVSWSTPLFPLVQAQTSSSSSFASSSIGRLGGANTPNDSLVSCGPPQAPHISIELSERAPSELERSRRAEPSRPSSQPVDRDQNGDLENRENKPSSTPTGSPAKASKQAASFKSNFKKLVKRQQSVDSYRMARDLKQKQRRQQEGERNKHQSNEAIKATRSVGDEQPSGRKFSMRTLTDHRGDEQARGSPVRNIKAGLVRVKIFGDSGDPSRGSKKGAEEQKAVEICVDPYARPGSFVLPGEQAPKGHHEKRPTGPVQGTKQATPATKTKVSPTPPNTLSLAPANSAGSNSSLLMGSGFSGCITPTYPTHHLPSPKYVSPATLMAMQKKYSNASTISSSFGAELGASANYQALTNDCSQHSVGGANLSSGNNSVAPPATAAGTAAASAIASGAAAAGQLTDSESSFSMTHSGRASRTDDLHGPQQHQQHHQAQQMHLRQAGLSANQMPSLATGGAQASAQDEAAAALRRANLAEHIYDNKCGLGEDMKFLASLPELCDITFLVGETREPVCAVKSVLAARSRVFNKILFGNRVRTTVAQADPCDANETPGRAQAQTTGEPLDGTRDSPDRRSSSPRSAGRTLANLAKSSLPSSRSSSPNQQKQQQQQQQQQWSVTSDASGYRASRPAPPVRADSSLASNRSGRASAASNGRESISRTSQGSQQPLIIGPGQTATPAPKQRLKRHRLGRGVDSSGAFDGATTGAASSRNNRLSRMFSNKRASDPSIKHNHLAPINNVGSAPAESGPSANSGAASNSMTNQNYLDKMSSSQKSTTMIIEEFEPDVFRQLIEYIHTGCVLLQARTLLGLLNAADYYGLEQLRRACLRFVSCCITVDTVCSLLSTAERYIQYKCTKSIVQKVLEFVDTHANEIFKLNAFGLLPEHVVRLILARDGLQADEHHKYNGVYTWCEHYCRSFELTNIADIMRNFLDLIQFHKIPTNVLLSEIYPTHIVPDEIFLSALAYQADPGVFDDETPRPRRMTLPNTIMFKDYEDEPEPGPDEGGRSATPAERRQEAKRLNYQRRKSNSGVAGRETTNPASGASSRRRLLLGARKSTAGPGDTSKTASASAAAAGGAKSSNKSGRKGSIAQVSISGVMRLSHKLSIRKRQSNVVTSSASPSATASDARRRGSSGSSGTGKARSPALAAGSIVSKQASIAQSGVSGSLAGSCEQPVQRDPIQVGRQILDAYLLAQRQRELEEEEKRRREEAEQWAVEEAKRRAAGLPMEPQVEGQPKLSSGQQQRALAKRPLVKTPSSTRKSFRDFKHISRRLFMRHSSSKTILQSQQSSTSMTSASLSLDRPGESPMAAARAPGQLEKAPSAGGGGGQSSTSEKSRRLLKIKRSETVFEATPSSGASSRLFSSGSRKQN